VVALPGRHGSRLVEAYRLDFSGDLYGQWIEVRLYVRLRPQRRFLDVGALIGADEAASSAALG
jgi:riboflavin kinase/FMN adenylyltransferase